MTDKKTEAKDAKTSAKAKAEVVDVNAEKQRDPLNQAVKEHSEEVAMTQDEIRRTRNGGPLGARREELASMQPDLSAPKGK